MKKSHLNIFMFALSMGLAVPSYLEAANEVSATAEQNQQPTSTAAPAAEQPAAPTAEQPAAPTAEQPAAPDATHPVEGQHAPEQHKTEETVAGDATESAKEALAEGAEKGVTGEKTKKKRKKGKKGKGKKSHGKHASAVCQPPADVLSKLDARNNTKESDVVCDTPAASCDTSAVTTSEAPMASVEAADEASEK
jgi:hypothetical protein